MKMPAKGMVFAVAGLLCFASAGFTGLEETPSGADKEVLVPDSGPGRTSQDNLDLTSLNQEIPDWRARWELARVLSYAQRYEESIAAYKKVLKAQPDLTKAKLEMAKVMAWAGHREKAQKILESFPSQDLDPEARIELADIYAAQKEYEPAISIYKAYLKNHADKDRVRLKLAQTLGWASEYEQSLQEYQTLLDRHPKDIQLRRQYAQVLTWAERYDQAIAQYQKTLQD